MPDRCSSNGNKDGKISSKEKYKNKNKKQEKEEKREKVS